MNFLSGIELHTNIIPAIYTEKIIGSWVRRSGTRIVVGVCLIFFLIGIVMIFGLHLGIIIAQIFLYLRIGLIGKYGNLKVNW